MCVCVYLCVKNLRAALLSKMPAGSAGLVEELRLQLQLKELLFQKVLSDRSTQAQLHQAELQELIHALSSRDQSSQVIGPRSLNYHP